MDPTGSNLAGKHWLPPGPALRQLSSHCRIKSQIGAGSRNTNLTERREEMARHCQCFAVALIVCAGWSSQSLSFCQIFSFSCQCRRRRRRRRRRGERSGNAGLGQPCKSPELLGLDWTGRAGLTGLAAICTEIGSADEDWLLISPEIRR